VKVSRVLDGHPDRSRIPAGSTTRFAPAPTGYLHLGHVANALFVWGVARAIGGRVVLRIEDHDRVRCRPEYEAALLDDLEWLGFEPDAPPIADLCAGPSSYRQSDSSGAYDGALARLRQTGLVYACDCSRSTFATWAAVHGRPWHGPGCPGMCRERRLAESNVVGIRVALGFGDESFDDLIAGPTEGQPTAGGDLLARDRAGNWTYAFCVVVDDIRHGIDLVIRGRDLLDDTARQIRLARLLGRAAPPLFLHHPLILREDGTKLSKASGATGIRDLRDTGAPASEVLGSAAAGVGLIDEAAPMAIADVLGLFANRPRLRGELSSASSPP
jgi:glutamyl/glutaminyl-tRNA synthetase